MNTLKSFLAEGVRQECNLSPLLFCLFLSDLEVSLEGGEMEGVNLVYSKLRLLLFTDDLVLLSKDLQLAVDLLSEYCATWDLNINLIKTKIYNPLYQTPEIHEPHTHLMEWRSKSPKSTSTWVYLCPPTAHLNQPFTLLQRKLTKHCSHS